jgi:NADH-quinone oxidoreductase subunit G
VLRVLGNLLGVPGFDFETVEDVRADAVGDGSGIAARLDNASAAAPEVAPAPAPGSAIVCERIADVPIYATDPWVRRASSLQRTTDAQPPVVGVSSPLWAALRLEDKVLVQMGEAAIVLPAREDRTLAEGAVRIAAGHPATASLGAMFGTVRLERV